MIEVGHGVALLPQPTFYQEVRAGSLVARPLEGCQFVRPIGVIHRRQPRLSGSTTFHFIKLLQEGCGQRARSPLERPCREWPCPQAPTDCCHEETVT